MKNILKTKIEKAHLLILAGLVLVVGAVVYFVIRPKTKEESRQVPPKEKTMEEILQDLTAPFGKAAEVSEKTLKSLTAPQKKVPPVSKEILDSLTPPLQK